jgi:hypothetical protein
MKFHKKDWRQIRHGSIPIDNRKNLYSLFYADVQVLLSDSEDNLRLSLHNLNKTATVYDMEIYREETKVLAFREKDPVPSKI